MDSENKSFVSENGEQKTENRPSICPPSSVLRPLEVGFPIRRFTDQSPFAAPHDLSQRTTSFIASQRQGIHQIPFRHLIALIAKTRSRAPEDRGRTTEDEDAWHPDLPPGFRFPTQSSAIRKDQFCFKRIRGSWRSATWTRDWLLDGRRGTDGRGRINPSSDFRHPASDNRMRFLFTMSDIGGGGTDDRGHQSSRRPSRLPSARALSRPDETDLLHRKGLEPEDANPRRRGHPISVVRPPPPEDGTPSPRLVELDGIEPTTSCLQSTRSPN
jgi:hypothetical protein